MRPTVCAPLKHLNFKSEKWESSHLNFSFEKCIVADDSHRELVELGSAPLANLLGFLRNLCADTAATDRHLGASGC